MPQVLRANQEGKLQDIMPLSLPLSATPAQVFLAKREEKVMQNQQHTHCATAAGPFPSLDVCLCVCFSQPQSTFGGATLKPGYVLMAGGERGGGKSPLQTEPPAAAAVW